MKKKKIALLTLLVALGATIAWALLPQGVDPQVAKVTELQQKLFANGPGGNSTTTPDERRKAFREFRQELEKLTDEQRDQWMRDHPPPFARAMQKRIRDFFELSPDKRKEALDRSIDEGEARRREMEKRFAANGGRPGGFGPPFGGRNMDSQQRASMAKRMLDNTSPQDRAQMSEYGRQMQERRRERGLPPMRGPRF